MNNPNNRDRARSGAPSANQRAKISGQLQHAGFPEVVILGDDHHHLVHLTDKQVASMIGVQRATPWRWVAAGNFPKPVKLGPGVTRWRLSDVENWLAERAAASEGAA